MSVARGLEAAGATIVRKGREDLPTFGTDLVLQTGMGPTPALMGAAASGVPYIIAENPWYRHLSAVTTMTWVSWGYNGLCGGAWYPPTPKEELWVPALEPLREEGKTIIFGQKLKDHSMRGTDHEAWLEKMMALYPEAELRPHPLMVKQTLQPLKEALDGCKEAITYTSTVGAEALINGSVSKPYHWGSSAYDVDDREEWMHDLSWRHFTKEFMASVVVGRHILAGFEEARERARRGLLETPTIHCPQQLKNCYQYNQTIRERIDGTQS